MRLFLLMLPFWALATHGCQWLGRIDESRVVETARMDHSNCVERGYTWPSETYTECRRLHADARQRRQWSELQLSRQQGQPEVGIQPGSTVEPYRPIREENFRCIDATSADGETYVACSESGR